MIEHYVLFKAKPDREAEVTAAVTEFDSAIRGESFVIELTYGSNINPRSVELGWTHGMLSRLPDYETFQTVYWNHDAHLHFLEQLDELCESRFALDYEVP